MLNLVGKGAEVGGLPLGSCGPNEHSLWGVWVERIAPASGAIRPSGWSDLHQRVERFAPSHDSRAEPPSAISGHVFS